MFKWLRNLSDSTNRELLSQAEAHQSTSPTGKEIHIGVPRQWPLEWEELVKPVVESAGYVKRAALVVADRPDLGETFYLALLEVDDPMVLPEIVASIQSRIRQEHALLLPLNITTWDYIPTDMIIERYPELVFFERTH